MSNDDIYTLSKWADIRKGRTVGEFAIVTQVGDGDGDYYRCEYLVAPDKARGLLAWLATNLGVVDLTQHVLGELQLTRHKLEVSVEELREQSTAQRDEFTRKLDVAYAAMDGLREHLGKAVEEREHARSERDRTLAQNADLTAQRDDLAKLLASARKYSEEQTATLVSQSAKVEKLTKRVAEIATERDGYMRDYYAMKDRAAAAESSLLIAVGEINKLNGAGLQAVLCSEETEKLRRERNALQQKHEELARRCEAAESREMQLIRQIADLGDPADVHRLRQDYDTLYADHATLKRDSELTISTLRENLRLSVEREREFVRQREALGEVDKAQQMAKRLAEERDVLHGRVDTRGEIERLQTALNLAFATVRTLEARAKKQEEVIGKICLALSGLTVST